MYQPVFEITTMRCVGVEALARSLNGSPPDLWFDMADRSAAGIEFEVAAVRKAIEAIPALQDGIWVSVNVTPATLSSGHLSEALMDFPQERLVVELSEYAEPSDPDALVDQARVLRSRGVRLAIDDFGAGLCEIRQILDLRPDFIKLHRSLVAGIARDFTKEALIASLVQFARGTGTEIVGEGIERMSELKTLRSVGVRLGQGCFLASPVELPAALARLGLLRHPALT